MSCCGKKRAQVLQAQTAPAQTTTVLFEYTGATGLSIVGPVTRTAYRFDRPGARAMVDSRDRASLSAVPVLRRVTY